MSKKLKLVLAVIDEDDKEIVHTIFDSTSFDFIKNGVVLKLSLPAMLDNVIKQMEEKGYKK
jgi:hypothetical protein